MMNLKKYLVCSTLLGTSLVASAQVSVNGNNVSVNTRDGTAVNVNGGRVVVNTPNHGQTAVAVGSGRTAVNVGNGNVVSNTAGSMNSGDKPKEPRNNPKTKQRKSEQSSDKDEAFWGKGGFWGENGKP